MTHSTLTVTPTSSVPATSTVPAMTVGLDVGDKTTHFCALDADRKVVARGAFTTTHQELLEKLARFAGARVILEAGSQSPWMSRALREQGFVV